MIPTFYSLDTCCILDGGYSFWLRMPCLKKRRGTMEQHYQLGVETLERQFLHSHYQMRAHLPDSQAESSSPHVHTENRFCALILPFLHDIHGIVGIDVVKNNRLVAIQSCYLRHLSNVCNLSNLSSLSN
jgi:hypothetical protein